MIGNKINFESARGDGEVWEYTVESYDEKAAEVTLSRELGSRKVLLKVPIKINDNDRANSLALNQTIDLVQYSPFQANLFIWQEFNY